MKIQNIYVNGCQEHTINYDRISSKSEKFIVDLQDGKPSAIELFTFSADDGCYIIETDEGPQKFDMEAKLSSKKDMIGKIDVEFTFKKNSSNQKTGKSLSKNKSTETLVEDEAGIVKLEAKNVSIDVEGEKRQYIVVILKLNWKQVPVEINAKFSAEFDAEQESYQESYQDEIRVYVAKREQVFDVMLDFGSEATQMAIASRQESIDVRAFKALFMSVKKKYGVEPDGENPDSDYYQYESGNNQLFRSYTLVKKEIDDEDVIRIQENPMLEINGRCEGEKNEISVVQKNLFTKKFYNAHQEEYIVAPNIKLSGFGGVQLPTINVGDESVYINQIAGENSYFLYRRSMALFIVEALSDTKIMQRGVRVTEVQPRFVSFHVLMPNVYKHSEVLTILDLLQKDIENIINGNAKFQSVIKGFEITAVSESDASIMGALSHMHVNNQPWAEGNYLLLDAGKGTLDFSLVKCSISAENKVVFKNIWRTGIIGAGNSLTYSYLLALFREYMEERGLDVDDNMLKDALYQKCIVSADVKDLLDLMRAVETYKSKPKFENDDRKKSEEDRLESVSKLNISKFAAWILEGIAADRVVKMKHKEMYVDKMVEALVKNVVSKINKMQSGRDIKIDGVIYAGRAFLLTDFKAELHKAIKKNCGNEMIKEISFMNSDKAVTMKNVCLLCRPVISEGRYSRKLLSQPVICSTKLTHDETVLSTTSSSIPKESGSIIGKVKSKLADVFMPKTKKDDKVLISVLEGMEVNLNIGKTKLEGTQLKVSNILCENLNIGGQFFDLNGVDSGNYDAFFDGKCYVLRNVETNKSHMFENPNYSLETSVFVQSSLFPHISVNSPNDIVLVPEIHAETKSQDVYKLEKQEPADDTSSRVAASPIDPSAEIQKMKDELESKVV